MRHKISDEMSSGNSVLVEVNHDSEKLEDDDFINKMFECGVYVGLSSDELDLS